MKGVDGTSCIINSQDGQAELNLSSLKGADKRPHGEHLFFAL